MHVSKKCHTCSTQRFRGLQLGPRCASTTVLRGALPGRAQALTPMQVGRVIVHSYPWLPDTMAVAAVVAAEAGDSAALSHLRADDSGGPGAFLAPRHQEAPAALGGAGSRVFVGFTPPAPAARCSCGWRRWANAWQGQKCRGSASSS